MDIRELKPVLHKPGLSRSEQLLLLLYGSGASPKSVADLRSLALATGVRGAKSWNLSAALSNLKGKALRTSAGWELTPTGSSEAKLLLGHAVAAPVTQLSGLRARLPSIANPAVREFLSEAIACTEAGHFRAAVVLTWVGAVASLYEVVLRAHLPSFNAEASRRDAKWKSAVTADDLARMKETDFLNVLEALSLIGKSVKTELEGCLKLRNGCGHPNSLRISEHRVAAHIETLVLNVFERFA